MGRYPPTVWRQSPGRNRRCNHPSIYFSYCILFSRYLFPRITKSGHRIRISRQETRSIIRLSGALFKSNPAAMFAPPNSQFPAFFLIFYTPQSAGRDLLSSLKIDCAILLWAFWVCGSTQRGCNARGRCWPESMQPVCAIIRRHWLPETSSRLCEDMLSFWRLMRLGW